MKKIGNTEYTTLDDLLNGKEFINDKENERLEFEVALIGKLIEARKSKGITRQELAG